MPYMPYMHHMTYMPHMLHILSGLTLIVVVAAAAECRTDGACYLPIPGGGSMQNPSLAEDGRTLLYTRWDSYNAGRARICKFDVQTAVQSGLVDGVNLPGISIWYGREAAYCGTGKRDHEEAMAINVDTKAVRQLSDQSSKQAWEPTFSRDGQWVTFEQHGLGDSEEEEYNGTIIKHRIGTATYTAISPAGWLCKQPYWLPDGSILFQRSSAASESAKIDIYRHDGGSPAKILSDASDVTASPGGQWLLFSNEAAGGIYAAKLASITTSTKVRISTPPKGHYDGACGWSFDGKWIVFETVNSTDPESGGKYARIAMMRVPPSISESGGPSPTPVPVPASSRVPSSTRPPVPVPASSAPASHPPASTRIPVPTPVPASSAPVSQPPASTRPPPTPTGPPAPVTCPRVEKIKKNGSKWTITLTWNASTLNSTVHCGAITFRAGRGDVQRAQRPQELTRPA